MWLVNLISVCLAGGLGRVLILWRQARRCAVPGVRLSLCVTRRQVPGGPVNPRGGGIRDSRMASTGTASIAYPSSGVMLPQHISNWPHFGTSTNNSLNVKQINQRCLNVGAYSNTFCHHSSAIGLAYQSP